MPGKTDKILCLYFFSVGPNGASSGEVYARAMVEGIDLATHEKLVAELSRQGLLESKGHWISLTARGRKLHDDMAEIVLKGSIPTPVPPSTPTPS